MIAPTPPPSPRSASALHRLGVALAAGLSASLGLALLNLLQTMLAARPYRDDLGRAASLFAVGLGTYAALAGVPIAVASLLHSAREVGRVGGWGAFLASRVGTAGAVAALLVAVGLLAPPAGRGSLMTAPLMVDAWAAVLAAAAVGWGAHRLALFAGASAVTAGRLRIALCLLAGLQVTLLGWSVAADRLGIEPRSVAGVSVAVGVLIAGLLIGFCLSECVRLLLRRIRERRGGTVGASRSRAAVIGAVVLAIALVGLAGKRLLDAAHFEGRTVVGRRPNVLMIVVDTLRRDHLGCYGATTVRSPHIDALAATGTRVENAYAVSSWTLPTTASILTGLYPSSHGLMSQKDSMHEDNVSASAVFKAAGYDTAGMVMNPILLSSYGFGEGFDLWERYDMGVLFRHRGSPVVATLAAFNLWRVPYNFPPAAQLVDNALAWLGERRDAPFFLYLQFMDPHDPYLPPPPYDRMYRDSRIPPSQLTREEMKLAIDHGAIPLHPEDLKRQEALYQGEVSYVDEQVGRLLGKMAAAGLADNTLVVFTADHGEQFIEHGGTGHSNTLYEELVRIPLIFSGPGVGAGKFVTESVSQIDLAPTILEAAGLSFPRPIEGRSIWGGLSGKEALAEQDILMELVYVRMRHPYHLFRSVRRGPLKLIGSSFFVNGNGPWKWELYDLDRDPAESVDLTPFRPEAEALRTRLQAWAGRPRARRAQKPRWDEDREKQLRALGYIQ